jgi:hypothetical protein
MKRAAPLHQSMNCLVLIITTTIIGRDKPSIGEQNAVVQDIYSK